MCSHRAQHDNSTSSSQRFRLGTVVAKIFGDRNYRGEVVAFDPKYKYYKIKYEDADVEEMMNETEVGRHLVSNPNALLPQPQLPPRVAKQTTYATATTKRGRPRRFQRQVSPTTSNYYDCLTPTDDSTPDEKANNDDETVITSNRTTKAPTNRPRRRRKPTTISTTPTVPAQTKVASKSKPKVAKPPRRRSHRERGYSPPRNPTPRASTRLSTRHVAHMAAFSPLPSLQHFANAVVHPDTGAMLEYRDLLKTDMRDQFIQANIDEIGRLTEESPQITFIKRHALCIITELI